MHKTEPSSIKLRSNFLVRVLTVREVLRKISISSCWSKVSWVNAMHDIFQLHHDHYKHHHPSGFHDNDDHHLWKPSGRSSGNLCCQTKVAHYCCQLPWHPDKHQDKGLSNIMRPMVALFFFALITSLSKSISPCIATWLLLYEHILGGEVPEVFNIILTKIIMR